MRTRGPLPLHRHCAAGRHVRPPRVEQQPCGIEPPVRPGVSGMFLLMRRKLAECRRAAACRDGVS